jgi:hypothetical protein
VGEAEGEGGAGGEGDGGGPQDRAAAEEAVEADPEQGAGGAAEGGHSGHAAVRGDQVGALAAPPRPGGPVPGTQQFGDHGRAADAVGPGADQQAEGERVQQQ